MPISFDQGFSIEYPFGKISAKKAHSKDLNLDTEFILKDDVKAQFKNTSIFADVASLKKNELFFEGSAEKKALLQDTFNKLPLIITAKTITGNISTKEKTIKEIHFNKAVELTYDKEFYLTGDRASYQPLSFFILEGNNCHIIAQENNIDATKVIIDLKTHLIHFENPHGKTSINKSSSFDFSSKTLIWDKDENNFTLENEVCFKQDSLQLTCDKLTLEKNIALATGKIHINLQDEYALDYLGKLTFDPQSKTATSTNTNPLRIKNKDVTILADKADICLKKNPPKIFLQGDIRIENDTFFAKGDTLFFGPESILEGDIFFLEKQNNTTGNAKKVIFSKNQAKIVGKAHITVKKDFIQKNLKALLD